MRLAVPLSSAAVVPAVPAALSLLVVRAAAPVRAVVPARAAVPAQAGLAAQVGQAAQLALVGPEVPEALEALAVLEGA